MLTQIYAKFECIYPSDLFKTWIFVYIILIKIFSKLYKRLLSIPLVTNIFCAECFWFFKKLSELHSLPDEIGSWGYYVYRCTTKLTSLYISESKWWMKQTKTLPISTVIVAKSKSVVWIKLDLLPSNTYQEDIWRYFFNFLQKGESVAESVADIHHWVSPIPVDGLEISIFYSNILPIAK